jgi:hypothetical protein
MRILLFILTLLSFDTFAQKTAAQLTLKELGDQYLHEQRKASDDSLTFLIFDSLSNPSFATRQYCFKVAAFIAKKSDGALSEAIGVYAVSYFSEYTKEFIKNISTLAASEQDSWVYYIGAELVISAIPKDNQTEMQYAQEGLDKIKASCKNCSSKDVKKIDDFNVKVLKVVEDNLK